MSLLECTDLQVSYGRNKVLHGVDVRVDAGEVLGLLGTNGAGKSTLLRAISGLTPPRHGKVRFDGKDTTGWSPMKMARLGLAYMPGGRGIFPDLSVAENLRMATWVTRKDKDYCAAAVTRAIELFPALTTRMEDRAGLLSGGQQQMLALAQALVQGPAGTDGKPGARVLLIDELSLGLAPAIVSELLDVVRHLRDEGLGILLVEQSAELVLKVSDRAMFLEKGEVRFSGPAQEILDRGDLIRSVFLAGALEQDSRGAPPPDDPPEKRSHDREELPHIDELHLEDSPARTPTEDDISSGGGARPVNVTGTRAEGVELDDETGELPRVVREARPAPKRAAGSDDEDEDFADIAEALDAAADAAPTPKVAIATRNLRKTFGGVAAIAGVDIDISAGEIVGLMGPNGAGKTTILDAMSGFLVPDTGRVYFKGTDVTDLTPQARAHLGLGRSFQDAKLFPGLTVTETIAVSCERWVTSREPLAAALRLPASLLSEIDVAERVDRIITLLGLGVFQDRFASELSTGSRRLVEFGCLLAQEPDVLLLDEPAAGLARAEAELMGPLMKRIREATGGALVIVEHDVGLLRRTCDRIIALESGRVVAQGPPDEVLSDPTVIATYLGAEAAAAS
ncbi:ATP-binding cassette domain-containing protein [Sporichthya polymorpha]|uniref:ATP-binding cassette domain-containing protein n=1 Tax=Sporichthya polymorpha TaxID=35751 RepID=UPI0003A5F58C|nr:ATP-binding cassette domain-containing protein [Sporichthya polymorpha]